MKILSLLLSLALASFPVPSDTVKGPQSKAPSLHALTQARVTVAPGRVLPSATILIKDDKIVAVGAQVEIPKGARVHNLSGKSVYPAFIQAWSHGGMAKPQAAPTWGTKPQYESTEKGLTSWNEAIKGQAQMVGQLDSVELPVQSLRKQGFGALHWVPVDGIARGTSTLLNLNEGKALDRVLKVDASTVWSFEKGSSKQHYPSSLMGSIALIRQTHYDLQWYESQWSLGRDLPTDLSLGALSRHRSLGLPLFFETSELEDVFRFHKIAQEFGLKPIIKTSGHGYQRLEWLAKHKPALVVPLSFPKAQPLTDPLAVKGISLRSLKHWEQAPTNPAQLVKAGVEFAFSVDEKENFWGSIQKAVAHGLSPKEALRALTLTPAKMLGVGDRLGTLEPGKLASLVVTSNKPFETKDPVVFETWVAGSRYSFEPLAAKKRYHLLLNGTRFVLDMEGKLFEGGKEVKPLNFEVKNGVTTLSFNYQGGTYYLQGRETKKGFSGTLTDLAGQRYSFTGAEEPPRMPKKATAVAKASEVGGVTFPNQAFGFERLPGMDHVVLKGATLWTNTDAGVMEGDLLLRNGRIAGVGQGLTAPTVIDATGLHITPGIIDEHSHIAIRKGVNEATYPITAEVSIGDVVRADDFDMYRQLSGGVVAAQLLHGSANPMGGRSGIIKFRWGSMPEEMKIKGATPFIKFALGENVKQSNWGDDYVTRYPQTRMGVETFMEDAFERALQYEAQKQAETLDNPVRRDLQLEVLVDILRERRRVTCHSYVQSEILMLMRLAERKGFGINTFTHVLEGYKIAPELAAHGASGSTFSDWWAYKNEVRDAIPYNAALMYEAGVNTILNSDDEDMAQRLNQEAAKVVKYGGVPEVDALKMVTLNPAKALHLDHRMGSLEVGKDADVVLWTHKPLSMKAQVLKTYVDGRLLYDRDRDAKLREANAQERQRLLNKMQASPGPRLVQKEVKQPTYHCETRGGLNHAH